MSVTQLAGLSVPKERWNGAGPVAVTVTAKKESNAQLQIDQLVGSLKA